MHTSKVNIPNCKITINNPLAFTSVYGLSNMFTYYLQGKVMLFFLNSNEETKIEYVSKGQDQNHIACEHEWSM